MDHLYAAPRLNVDHKLGARLTEALLGATRFGAAIAYMKLSGVEVLTRAGVPAKTRFVVGTGFALTDPDAVEALEALGASTRVVVGSANLAASAFHPKLYVVSDAEAITVFSGSAISHARRPREQRRAIRGASDGARLQ